MTQSAYLASLVPDVYILHSPFYESKRGLVLDAEGSVLVDTSVSLAETEMMVEEADAQGKPVRRIVLTHGHFDHSAGCQLLPSSERIAQRGAGEWMLSEHAANYLAQRPPEHPDLARLRITLPTIELEGPAKLRMDRWTLHMLPTPGHSPDGMCILLEPEGVLFTGDTVVTCFPPIIQDGSSAELVASLRCILALEFARLVPGHGPVLGPAAARHHLLTSLRYLEELQHEISQFDDPDTLPQVITAAVDHLRSAFPFPAETVKAWHDKAVSKVWEERQGSLVDSGIHGE